MNKNMRKEDIISVVLVLMAIGWIIYHFIQLIL